MLGKWLGEKWQQGVQGDHLGGCPRWEMVIVYNSEASKDKEKMVLIQYILGGKLARSC